MRNLKNKGVVYTGKVGANMSIKMPTKRNSRKKSPMPCKNGPMQGETLWFDDSIFTSAIFTYRGDTGRYIKGDWVKA